MKAKHHVTPYNTIVGPHVSEKASRVQENDQYVFKVAVGANKSDIKVAVEKLFDVTVKSITVLNMAGKKKRFGQFTGQRKNWKKAYVRLQKGQSIELFETE